MKKSNIVYLMLILVLFIPLISTAQMQEERRLHEIEQELMELERKLEEEMHPEDRGRFQQNAEELHAEKRGLEEFLNNGKDRKEHTNEHPDENGLDPTIVVAIIGALGAIIVAIIGIKKGKSS